MADKNSLSFSVRFDTADLMDSLDDAEKSCQQKIKAINNKLKSDNLKIEAQISAAQLAGDDKAVASLISQKKENAAKLQALALETLRKEYDSLTDAERNNAEISRMWENRLASQEIRTNKAAKAAADFKKGGESVGQAWTLAKGEVLDALSKYNPAAAAAARAIDNLGSVLLSTAKKSIAGGNNFEKGARLIVGIGGLAATGVRALNNEIVGKSGAAARSLTSLNRQAQALGVSLKELSKINLMAQIAGVDPQPLIARMAELNRAISTAGENGNKATKLLDRWGISLRNVDGTYKTFSGQLETLAARYQMINDPAERMAFTTEVLGTSAAEAAPLLDNLQKYAGRLGDVIKVGAASPEVAERLQENLNILEAQEKASAGIFGRVGMEAANEYTEAQIRVNIARAEWLKQNPEIVDGMKRAAVLVAEIQGGMAIAVATIANMVAKNPEILAFAGAISAAAVAVKALSLAAKGLAAARIVASIASLGPIGAGIAAAAAGAGVGALAAKFGSFSEMFDKLDSASQANEEIEKIQSSIEKAQAAIKEQAGAAETAAAQDNTLADDKERLNAAREIQEQIFELQHTAEENAAHRIDIQADKYREEGVNEVDITEWVVLQKGKIESEAAEKRRAEAEKAAEEEQKRQEEAIRQAQEAAEKEAAAAKKAAEERQRAEAEIDSVFRTSIENQISEIEKKKEAWIQAGADMVEAEKAAQKQIQEARMSEAERYLNQRKEMVKYAARLEKAGVNSDEIAAKVNEYALKGEYKALGLNASQVEAGGRWMSLINGAAEAARRNVLAPVTRAIANNVTVNITGNVVENEGMLNTLADKVSGRIISKVGVENDY